MFGNLGTHVLQFPSGKWGFVGTLPIALGELRPATSSDVLGCRAWRDEQDNLVAPHFPAFPSEQDARDHAAACGVSLSN